MWFSRSFGAHFTIIIIICLGQTAFAAYGKEVQLISGFAYAETGQLSQLTSLNGIPATSRW